MAGSITEMEKSESDSQDFQFVWDENSKLYFHASGFYHDPNAGWYYSTRDGLYYKFEDGDYVLLNSDQSDKSEASEMESNVPESSSRDEQCAKVVSKDEIGNAEFTNSYSPENHRPPSEWLEETLIDLYLSGYTRQAIDKVGRDATSPKKTDEVDIVEFQSNEDPNAYELEEGEWIPEDDFDSDQVNEDASDDCGFAREEEENWRSQYGQVIRSSEEDEEGIVDIPAVELWDWSTVKGTKKNGKGEITKLVGRLMKKSTKLHPSMPCGGVRLKTAPICEVRLDLVRVTTGQVYRLRNPSSELLASLSAYDSSDPTKDWGFPELSLHEVKQSVNNPSSHNPITDAKAGGKNSAVAREKNKSQLYRDRAAERRALHGAFGVAPGQETREDVGESGLQSEEAAAQALDMSFGSGSYARKLLEGMGWKQGEALGKSMKGLVEPIQAEGNIGSAGLGWPRGRSKHPFNY